MRGVVQLGVKETRRLGAASVAALLVVAACTQDARTVRSRPAAPPSPTASGLCQPFPDRLLDEFLAAYNARDLDALEALVTAPVVEDPVAAGYGADLSFDGVEEWARAAWAAGDRMRASGYSAFHPSKTGFQMLVTRASDRLSEAGIERVSMTLNAGTEGCTITSLTATGAIQAKGDPCAFYTRFRTAAGPEACGDGSAAFARTAPAAASADGRALVWGGTRGGFFTYGDAAMDGLLIDARSRRATRIRPPEMPAFRPEAEAWTGSELVVVGTGMRPPHEVVAAAYSPDTGAWRRIRFPFARGGGFEGVWTGRELLLWGGPERSEDPLRRGVAYDPFARDWRKTAPAPGGGRWSHAAVWTGAELIVFGGGNAKSHVAAGLAYDPATDAWRRIATSPLSPRESPALVWTGDEVLAWGGSSVSRSVADGAAYDPATDSWRKLPRAPLRPRHRHSAVWTGTEAIFFGGYDYRRSFADGAAYDPAADRWRRLSRAPVTPRSDHVAVWTGAEMLVFGGTYGAGHSALGDGAWYEPDRDRWRRIVPRVDGRGGRSSNA